MRQATTLHMFSRWVLLWASLFGASAFADYSPYRDLSVLTSAEYGSKYFIVGGARFLIPSNEYWFYSLLPSRYTVPQSVIDSITTVPRDNTVLKSLNSAPVYVVIGGRKWHITSPEELSYWGGDSAVRPVPTGSLQLYESDNYLLVRERTGSQIYVMVMGTRFMVNTQAELNSYGGEAMVKTVPLGSLYDVYMGPQCGQVLREFSSSTVYELGPDYFTLIVSKKPRTTSHPPEGIVPDGALADIPTTAAPLRYCID
ncbi:hypothetical protein BON30_47325 [Cystobacter ferrugineus]|uniref:Uncharacterized protein n=2 Tax=Cystobacter ferrugineus TaxID=83449 RepID=A0A1L9AUH0_9BACT|nr:hypothetical protein BON30_47325 [Cystobacter ferrugineus]